MARKVPNTQGTTQSHRDVELLVGSIVLDSRVSRRRYTSRRARMGKKASERMPARQGTRVLAYGQTSAGRRRARVAVIRARPFELDRSVRCSKL